MVSNPPNPPQSKMKADIGHLPYYHPELSHIDQVKEVMIRFVTQDGAFLLRNSFSKHDALTFSVMHDQSVKHFNVVRQLSGSTYRYYVQDQCFTCIEQLVEHFRNNDVPNQEGVRNVRLAHPIGRARPLPSPSHDRNRKFSSSSIGSSTSASSCHTLPTHLNRRIPNSPMNERHRTMSDTTPPLPPGRPITRNGSAPPRDLAGKLGAYGIHNGAYADDNERPPLPRPPEPVYNRDEYSRVVDVPNDRSHDLIRILEEQERLLDKQKCECGLTFKEARLPDNWTMHISHEAASNGRLFFTSPTGETSWDLPPQVFLKLTDEDRQKINKYYQRQSRPSLRSPAGGVGAANGTNISRSPSEASATSIGASTGRPIQHNEATGSTTGSNEASGTTLHNAPHFQLEPTDGSS